MIINAIAKLARGRATLRASAGRSGLHVAAVHASPPERRASGAVHVSCGPDALRRTPPTMPFTPALPASSVFRQLALWLLAAAGMLALCAPAFADDDFLPV